MWIFGYGSLMWRPDFDYVERAPARVDGFARRFWQGSPDHRGTPAEPGRVVTLLAEHRACCHGIVFRVGADRTSAVLDELDRREQGGYRRCEVRPTLADGRRVRALTYVGERGNPHYLGPASLSGMAAQIAASRGPSGANRDYLLQLVATLRELGVHDRHCEALARHPALADGS